MKPIVVIGLLLCYPVWPARAVAAERKAKSVQDLVADLDNKYLSIRLKAIRALGDRGVGAQAAVPALGKALRALDKEMRDEAVQALARIGLPAVGELIRELRDPKSRLPAKAALCLGRIGPEAAEAVPALIACLKDREMEVRAAAAHALGEIGPAAARAAPGLVLLLDSSNKEVRKQTNAALVNIGPEVVPALRGALKSPSAAVRMQAADLIAVHGDHAKQAVADVLALFKDKQPGVRRAAALALAAVGTDAREANDSLIALTGDSDAAVRSAAASALGAIQQGVHGIATLVKLFRDPVLDVRLQAALAIVKMGPTAVNFLMTAVPNENVQVRLCAIFALGEIGPEARAAVPLLIGQLKDAESVIRSHAALALGKIGPREAPKAIEPLKTLVKDDKDAAVRVSMRLALVQLQPGQPEAALELTTEVNTFVISTNRELTRQIVASTLRPRTAAEMRRQGQIQGVLNFYMFRNSFRFGDGLDKWSHAVLNSLGVEAIPAMVDTLNKEDIVGGVEGFIVNGIPVAQQPLYKTPNSVFFH